MSPAHPHLLTTALTLLLASMHSHPAEANKIEPLASSRPISFATEDGGIVHGNLYGKGARGVVLAHGGRHDKQSWDKQARVLADAGFGVLAFDFRGCGQSTGPGQADMLGAPLHLDVLAAVRQLRSTGSTSIAVAGGSRGGSAAGDASIAAGEGEIERLVLLASPPSLSGQPPEKMKGRKLFILARDDFSGDARIPRLPKIRDQYERATGPKSLVLLDGSAHAQAIFETDQGERLMQEILRFLSEP